MATTRQYQLVHVHSIQSGAPYEAVVAVYRTEREARHAKADANRKHGAYSHYVRRAAK